MQKIDENKKNNYIKIVFYVFFYNDLEIQYEF